MNSSKRRSSSESGQHGFTLFEVVVSVMLLSVLASAVMVGFNTSIQAGDAHRISAFNAEWSRRLEVAIDETPYLPRGDAAAYDTALASVPRPNGSTAQITAVTYWDGSATPTFTSSCNSSAAPRSAGGDMGAQRITYKTTSTRSGRTKTTNNTILKRYEGAYAEPPTDPPPGGSTCTISQPGQVDTNWVNETAGSPRNTTYNSGNEMNILYLFGTRRFSYLRFNIQAGVSTCNEGGTLPSGANIVAARLRLFTFNIGGLPACGANSCWHALERVRSNWDPSTLTWNNQPCPTANATSCRPGDVPSNILFQHGTGAFDWSARFQTIEHADLLADVRQFYSNPSTNYGWAIKEACALTYGKACGSATPGFQFRGRLGTPAERPALEVVYQ